MWETTETELECSRAGIDPRAFRSVVDNLSRMGCEESVLPSLSWLLNDEFEAGKSRAEQAAGLSDKHSERCDDALVALRSAKWAAIERTRAAVQHLVSGVGDAGVEIIAELDLALADIAARPEAPRTFKDWLCKRLGTRRWVVGRLTARNRHKYDLAITQRRYEALKADWEACFL